MQLLVQEAAKKYNWKNHKNFLLRNMQKIMTHGMKRYNVTFYQEISLQYYGKTFCIVVTVFNKKIKKKNIIMQFSVLGNNNYTINEQEHNTDRIFHHWKHQKKC